MRTVRCPHHPPSLSPGVSNDDDVLRLAGSQAVDGVRTSSLWHSWTCRCDCSLNWIATRRKGEASPYFFFLFRMSFCTDFVILLTCEESLLS